MSSELIRVVGGDLPAQVAGSGSPVLFVHGWALDHRAFKPQFEAFAASHRVITFDRRGFGKSTAPADLRREVADISSILDALEIDNVHLVGMSQGGRIALRYASEHPDRLQSLTLQGTAADEIHVEERAEEEIPIQNYVRLVRDGKLAEVTAHWLAHPMMSSDDNPTVQRELDAMLASYAGSDLQHFDHDSYAWPSGLLAKLRTMTLPVLLVTGAKDSVARRRIAARLCECLPNAREYVIADAGHLCNLTAVDEFNRTLEAFFREVG